MRPAATSPAPSRAPSGPDPRSASAGEVVDDALENDSTRVPGDAEKRPRGNPATRVPAVVGRSVDEVDAVTLPAPRRRPRPACDPRAPSADVRRCRTSSRSRSPARPRNPSTNSYGYTASYFSDRRPRAARATGAVFRHLRRGQGRPDCIVPRLRNQPLRPDLPRPNFARSSRC